VHIGAGSTLGAGSVAVADVPDGVTAAGVPARPTETNRATTEASV